MSVRRSAIWSYAGQFIFVASNFVGSVILARLLTPSEFGVYALANSVVAIIMAVQGFGFGNYIVTVPTLEPRRVQTVFTAATMQAALIILIILAISQPMALFYKESSLVAVLAAIAASYVFQPFQIVTDSILQREMRFASLTILQVVRAFVSVLVTIGLAMQGYSSLSFAYGTFVSTAIIAILSLMMTWRRAHFGFSIDHWRDIGSFGGWSAITGAIGQLGWRLPEMIVGHFFGMPGVGLYSRAFGLVDMARGLMLDAPMRVLLPALVRARERQEPLSQNYPHVVEVVTGLIWPAMMGLACFAYPVIGLLFGDQWEAAAPLLSLLAIMFALLNIFPGLGILIVMARRFREDAVIQIILILIGVVTMMVGGTFSLVGLVAARCVWGFLTNFGYWKIVRSETEFPARATIGVYIRSMAVTAAAAIPVAITILLSGSARHVVPLHMFLAIFVSIAFWVVAMRLTGHALFKEMQQIWGAMRGRT
jgi:O-antigen/teichoic acid export membrane protein